MQRVAYLCSEYPAISHTFIFREIQSLRQAGLEVYPITARPSANLAKMTLQEQEEAKQTKILQRITPLAGIHALLRIIGRSPLGFSKMTVQAISLCFSGPISPGKALAYWAEAILLIHWLQNNNIEHVHEHFANPTALLTLLAKRYGGISYSLSVHGPDVFFRVDSSLLALKLREAVFIRCISHYCRSQLWLISPHATWSKFYIIRCGVDTRHYHPVKKKEKVLGAEMAILCVGRLCPAKGQHILLKACAILREKKRAFQLTLVGDGEERQSLERLAMRLNLGEYVVFTGSLGQDAVEAHYCQADLFVLPSFAEGVPVVLMEAMAQEIPTISTCITGIPELIEHGRHGLLATVADVDNLAALMIKIFDNRRWAQGMAQEGRRQVISRYNQQQNAQELVTLFRDTI